jgi:TctA family transporter
MWIKLLQVPYRLLFPSILVFMAIGVYSVANNPFDVLIMAVFGLFGLLCMKLGMEPAPLALGVVLGPLMEENLRRAILLARGDPSVFLTRPISAGFILASLVMLLLLSLPALRRKREQVFAEEEPA